MEKNFYTLKDLKEMFGISVRTLREYIKSKELKAYKIGRTYFVVRNDLLVFIKNREAYRWRKRGDYPFDS